MASPEWRKEMRIYTVSLMLLLALTMGCGGSSTQTSSLEVSGAYEFVVTSNVTGGTTLVESNLAANGNQSSAAGPSQVQVLSLENKTWYVNGVCVGETPGQNTVTTAVSANNDVALTFNEGGNSFDGQGVLTGSAISGNYSVSDSKCPDLVGIIGVPPGSDSGGVAGNQVPALAGTFSGFLNLGDGTDNAALTLVESSNQTLAVSAVLTGPADSGTFPFSGSAVGNVMFVTGSVSGRALSLFGYFDRTGQFTGTPNSMMVFNYETLATAGLLIKQ
jgi:hypothetical protein